MFLMKCLLSRCLFFSEKGNVEANLPPLLDSKEVSYGAFL